MTFILVNLYLIIGVCITWIFKKQLAQAIRISVKKQELMEKSYKYALVALSLLWLPFIIFVFFTDESN